MFNLILCEKLSASFDVPSAGESYSYPQSESTGSEDLIQNYFFDHKRDRIWEFPFFAVDRRGKRPGKLQRGLSLGCYTVGSFQLSAGGSNHNQRLPLTLPPLPISRKGKRGLPKIKEESKAWQFKGKASQYRKTTLIALMRCKAS